MENKSFDDIIKSKLEQFSIESKETAWASLEDKLSDLAFDEKLRENIDGYKVNLPVDAWNNFEGAREDFDFDQSVENTLGKYDSGEIPTDFDLVKVRDTGSFDAIIGAKLASMSLDQGSDWENFEKILEGEDGFDQEVRNKVEDFEIASSENHWPKLSEHLEKIERRRRRILITKFIEAAVFILFVLSIMQLYPINNIGKQKIYRTHGVAEAIRNGGQQVKQEDSARSIQEDTQIASNVATKDEEQGLESGVLSSEFDEVVFEDEDAMNYVVVNESTSKERLIRSLAEVVSLRLSPIKSDQGISDRYRRPLVMNFVQAEKIASSEVLPITKKEELKNEFAEILLDKEQEEIYSQGQLASLDISPLEIDPRDFSIPVLDYNSKVKNKQYWFNIYGSPQFNMINTPYDKSYSDSRSINAVDDEIPAYSHLADGYTLGVGISKETANLELEGGVEYTSLNYLPKQITERVSSATFGYKDILLKEIIFDIVEFSANIKYSLFKKKGWKVYGTNGLSLGAVAFANYDIEEDEVIRPLASPRIKGSTERRPPSFLDRKDFNEGLVNTGNIKDNVFTTLNVGLGVSKEISDNISFYVQPTYYHNLSQGGIGPNNDVHHRLAMQIGTKVRI